METWGVRLVVLLACIQPAITGCDPPRIGVGGPNPADPGPCGSSAQTASPPPPTAAGDCKIIAGSCPHLGGDAIHDICADAHSRNVIWDGIAFANDMIPISWYANPPAGRAGKGCDAKMGERNFDALSWDSKQEHPILWEVKTEDYDGRSDYEKSCRLSRAISNYVRDCTVMTTCNRMIDVPENRLNYRFATWDEVLYRDLIDYLAKHPELLPMGAADFCNVDLATACKNGPKP